MLTYDSGALVNAQPSVRDWDLRDEDAVYT
jgi:hypothetical protein